MKLAHLVLLFPGYLAFRLILALSKWLRDGIAGFSGYEYTRSEDPGWYWLTIACSLVLVCFYVISGVFHSIEITNNQFQWGSTFNFLFLLLAISQEVGLLKRKPQPA